MVGLAMRLCVILDSTKQQLACIRGSRLDTNKSTRVMTDDIPHVLSRSTVEVINQSDHKPMQIALLKEQSVADYVIVGL